MGSYGGLTIELRRLFGGLWSDFFGIDVGGYCLTTRRYRWFTFLGFRTIGVDVSYHGNCLAYYGTLGHVLRYGDVFVVVGVQIGHGRYAGALQGDSYVSGGGLSNAS